MWFDISFLARGIIFGYNSQIPTLSSTRVNLVFSTSVRFFSQIVCQSACIFQYLKTLQLILVVQIHKIVLTLSLSPRVVFWVIFCQFLCCYFFDGNHSVASHHIIGITQRVTSLVKPFHSIPPPLLVAILRWFAPVFESCSQAKTSVLNLMW